MTFTQSEGLRDREYAKFEAVQAGSLSAIAIKPYVDSGGTDVAEPFKREVAVSGTLTVSGTSCIINTVPSGTTAYVNTILYATTSGTGTLRTVLCNSEGMLLTSGI